MRMEPARKGATEGYARALALSFFARALLVSARCRMQKLATLGGGRRPRAPGARVRCWSKSAARSGPFARARASGRVRRARWRRGGKGCQEAAVLLTRFRVALPAASATHSPAPLALAMRPAPGAVAPHAGPLHIAASAARASAAARGVRGTPRPSRRWAWSPQATGDTTRPRQTRARRASRATRRARGRRARQRRGRRCSSAPGSTQRSSTRSWRGRSTCTASSRGEGAPSSTLARSTRSFLGTLYRQKAGAGAPDERCGVA